MKFLRLTSELHVDPRLIQMVRVNNDHSYITVRMQDGEEHHIHRAYNQSVWDTRNALIKEIEDLTE
jgi:hypothetical protein